MLKSGCTVHIFDQQYNFSFKLPDNDTCDPSDAFLVKLKYFGEKIGEMKKQYGKHLDQAKLKYDEKLKDKKILYKKL